MSTLKAELKGIIALLLIAGVVVVALLAVTGTINIGLPGLQGPAPAVDKIAFISDRGGQTDLWLMDADGTGAARLTNDEYIESLPTWDLRGTKIFYVSNKPGTPQIFVVGADGGGAQQLTISTGAKVSLTTNSRGNLAFVALGKVFVMSGGTPEPILPTPAQQAEQLKETIGAAYDNPWPYKAAALAPDRSALAAVQDKTTRGCQEPQYLPGLGGEPQPLETDLGDPLVGGSINIAWEKHGTRIAVAITEGLLGGLWVTEPASPVANLVLSAKDAGVLPAEPDWSSDGRRIAFAGLDKDGVSTGLFVVSSTGGRPKKLVSGEVHHPKWSPNHALILYELSAEGKTDLWTIEVNGLKKRNLTKGNGNNTQAAWSPAILSRD